jgi:hypothetical protein
MMMEPKPYLREILETVFRERAKFDKGKTDTLISEFLSRPEAMATDDEIIVTAMAGFIDTKIREAA